ncbi:MAG: DNA polymerase III subunit alpha [Actinobacteria bacterium ADurb.Bin346]|nr:MAG: DNA polymerase III subunit alpha [Actinobacteria bacterium ADurb.Bin346]
MMGQQNQGNPFSQIIDSSENYLKSPREMAAMFYDIPQAVKNTIKIADECSFAFPEGGVTIPFFKTPSGESQDEHLRNLCCSGLAYRYGKNPCSRVLDRLSAELRVIKSTGFAGYFLVVADIARFAYENRIPICGKGSAAGSIVSYILRISNVDPIENSLYFERFLNIERTEPPDIDIDVSSRDREKISHYLCKKYGSNSVARVSSFATNKPRAALREAGRILNIAKDEIDSIIKAVPNYNRFFNAEKMRQSAESSGLADFSNKTYHRVFSIAESIGGYIRHVSMHPSAFIVSNQDLSGEIPLTLSETGEIMSQYDMHSIDSLGILKIDLINSLSLSLIADTSSVLEKNRKIHLDMSKTDYSDKKVYELMQKGQTLGIFQLESFGIRTLARKVKPSCLNDITLLVSLYRPGPQQSGMVDNFIERKFGREKTTCIHKDLEPILEETYGIILYQEQAMQAAIKIAGYSLSEADLLRKAMAGLSREEMAAQRSRFVTGALMRGYDETTASEVFRLISKFASYGFVKAHAAAYAEISYKTCYLKSRFPAEFISTILTNNSGYYSRMQYVDEARRLGVTIKLPDINESGAADFRTCSSGRSIRVPLISVRELGAAGSVSIEEERNRNGNFLCLQDFYERIKSNCRITKNAVENLIKVGAFDFTGTPRKQLLLSFYWLRETIKPVSLSKNSSGRSFQISFDISPFKPQLYRLESSRQNNISDSQIPDNAFCISKNTDTQDKTINSSSTGLSLEERLQMEADILGFYVSAHPLQCFKESIASQMPGIKKIIRSGCFYDWLLPCNQKTGSAGFSYPKDIYTAGIVISKRIEKTRGSKEMMFCTIEDEDGMYEAVFFPESYRKNMKIIASSTFIIIEGRLHFRDNNVSVIASRAASIAMLKKCAALQKEESIKAVFISETENPWKRKSYI